jgi:hypothetical protein
MQQQDNYTKLFNEKLDAALAAQVFPNLADAKCGGVMIAALSHHTEHSLTCSWDTYKALWEKPISEFTLLEACNALNAIEFSTPEQLGLSGIDYIVIKNEAKSIAATWNEIVTPIRTAISEEVQKQYDEDIAKEQARQKLSGGQPLPKKRIQFNQK